MQRWGKTSFTSKRNAPVVEEVNRKRKASEESDDDEPGFGGWRGAHVHPPGDRRAGVLLRPGLRRRQDQGRTALIGLWRTTGPMT